MSGQFDLSTVEQYERLEILNLPERGLISHVVIAGGGRNGFSIAELFHRIRLSLVLIDIDYRTVERAKLVGIPVVYGDAGYAFHRDGGVEPWAFNVGAECSELGPTDLRGAPFFAVNGHIREDYGWCCSVNAQAGWQWRGYGPGHLLRLGVNYFNGITEEYALGNVFEELVGIAAWYDY